MFYVVGAGEGVVLQEAVGGVAAMRNVTDNFLRGIAKQFRVPGSSRCHSGSFLRSAVF